MLLLGMAVYRGDRFEDQQVRLNGNEFYNCNFVNCQLVFDANGALTLDGCGFDNPRFLLDGSAADTINFLMNIYHTGGDGTGKQYVEDLFQAMRNGKI